MKSYLKLEHGLLLVPFLFVHLLIGCSILESDQDNSIENVILQLTIDKSEIVSGDNFKATYTATNLTNRKIDIVTGCISFATIAVYKDEQNMNFNGANMGCRTALGSYKVGPRETLKFEWDINAFTLSREVGQTTYDTTFVAPGDYTLRVYPHIGKINDEYISVEPESIGFTVK